MLKRESHIYPGAFRQVEVLQVAALADGDESRSRQVVAGAQVEVDEVGPSLIQQPRGHFVCHPT